jgi:hypothetical protein
MGGVGQKIAFVRGEIKGAHHEMVDPPVNNGRGSVMGFCS